MASTKDIKSTSHKKKYNDIYTKGILCQKVVVPIINVNQNILQTLKSIISNNIEGKCIVEGYIKPDSIEILTYSSGVLHSSNIIFEVTFECLICNPVEGMIINCIVKNITKAGIRAIISEEMNPLVIFIARDHHYLSQNFNNIKENEEIRVKIIGQRFELNDKYISIIGELKENKDTSKEKSDKGSVGKKRPKLIIE